MKKIVLALTCLLLTAAYASAQAKGPESLRGLKGVRLVIMFDRAEAMDEAQRAEVLDLLQNEAKAKFQEAGIPLLEFKPEIEKAGSPQFIIRITLDKPNGFVYPLVTEAKLLQKVRLARDPAVEMDASTWETFGVGAPKLTVEMIRTEIATEVDLFIKDYLSVNPKWRITAEELAFPRGKTVDQGGKIGAYSK